VAGDVVALVELGSNAVRLLVARLGPGIGFEVLEEKRVQTRLGSGRPGVLRADSIERTVAAVHQFLARARRDRDPRVIAVATAAVRDASNRERLLGPLRRRDRVEVRILSGREEALLGALAVQSSMRLEDGLVADLGGGSLQLTRLRGGQVASTSAVPIGAVRMTQRFLRGDPPAPRELRDLRTEVRNRLVKSLPPAARGEEIVALGGTVRALGRIHLAARGEEHRSRHGLRLQQADVTRIRSRLESLPIRKRRQVPGLRVERADIIVAGAVVIEELMTFGGYHGLTICKQGVRDALLLRETFAEEG
jgi:exopolyphosphatase / guanosine-5'-triphosphate,3'-diphosphate pyrophosphatase